MRDGGARGGPWLAAALLAASVTAPNADAQEYSQESIETYQAGMEAFNAGNLEQAIELFRESYEVHHGHPNALYNIGQCYERLGDLEQSINYYEQYLATDQAEGREEVYTHIRELRARKAVFTLRTVPAGAGVSVTDANGLPLTEYEALVTPCELELPPGTFVLHFEAEGYTPRTQVVDGGLGRHAVIEITLSQTTPGPGPTGPETPRGEVGRGFVGAYGGLAVHLNPELVPNAGLGVFGGYTLFDGDWRLDVGGDVGAVSYQFDGPGDTTSLTWFIEIAAVPALRWIILDELHFVGSLGLGVGVFTKPSTENARVPWAGGTLTQALTIIHFRPALALEYLPLSWLGIQFVPVAIDIDIPYSSTGTSRTSVLARYDAFLAVSFHI